jgi:hypothetical protein
VANTGSYELTDSLLIIRPVVARNPNFMQGGVDTLRYRLRDDTLWVTSNAPPPNDPWRQRKLVRVE